MAQHYRNRRPSAGFPLVIGVLVLVVAVAAAGVYALTEPPQPAYLSRIL